MNVGDTFNATRQEPDDRTIIRLFFIDRITSTGIVRASTKKLKLRRDHTFYIAKGHTASFRVNQTDGGLRLIISPRRKLLQTDWKFNNWHYGQKIVHLN